jgi:hypothetical protein
MLADILMTLLSFASLQTYVACHVLQGLDLLTCCQTDETAVGKVSVI